MAKNFKLNNAGFYNVRQQPKVREDLERRAQAIADECNRQAGLEDGYRISSTQGAKKPFGRWRTTVIAATAEAIKDNAENNRLVRNLDVGRR